MGSMVGSAWAPSLWELRQVSEGQAVPNRGYLVSSTHTISLGSCLRGLHRYSWGCRHLSLFPDPLAPPQAEPSVPSRPHLHSSPHPGRPGSRSPGPHAVQTPFSPSL